MRLTELECPNCGAILRVDEGQKNCSCEYCGHLFVLEEEKTAKAEDDVWNEPLQKEEPAGNPRNTYNNSKLATANVSKLSIAALIVSLFGCLSPIGVILGIVDLTKKDGKSKVLSIIAIAIGSFMLIMSILATSTATISTSSSVKESKTESGAVKETVKGPSAVSIGETFGNETISGVVTEADLDYQDYNDLWTRLEDDQKAIYAKITLTNLSDKSIYVSSGDFKCYADNVASKAELVTGGSEGYNANIEPGRAEVLGALYIVPRNADDIELEYKLPGSSSQKVVIKIQ
ncbi:MAG: DUF4352 domain-containing protein [Lachnospiraceae bacterium]|nr:DUF4352 domain-containing protein [Lachnospiraceae bacterium]